MTAQPGGREDSTPGPGMLEEVGGLLDRAATVYADDETARAQVEALRRRLQEPLRVALAGRIKAGKSTLLNAVVGEQLAPTDTGECTRVVTWYRHGEVPDVTLVLQDGTRERRPVRRIEGRLQLDTGQHGPEEVSRIVVTWPSPALADMTVVDTPGLASLSTEISERTTAALTPTDEVSQVDAVIYLMRHLHSSDAELLEALREARAGGASAVSTLAVLSRADEIGAGRIDAMVSASDVADRYARDPRVRSLALDVYPVAGLLAEGARTLRQVDYEALREVSQLPTATREALLVSADRFAHHRVDDLEIATTELRQDLLERLGAYGVRLSTALLRGPVPDATHLAKELTRRSGLGPLSRALTTQLAQRTEVLKARSALAGLERLSVDHPRGEVDDLLRQADQINLGEHALLELEWLARLRRDAAASLTAGQRKEAARILGRDGDASTARLGLRPSDDAEAQGRAVHEAIGRWGSIATDPLSDRETVEAAQVLVRSLDGILHRLGSA